MIELYIILSFVILKLARCNHTVKSKRIVHEVISANKLQLLHHWSKAKPA
jgi:hypothetical protein